MLDGHQGDIKTPQMLKALLPQQPDDVVLLLATSQSCMCLANCQLDRARSGLACFHLCDYGKVAIVLVVQRASVGQAACLLEDQIALSLLLPCFNVLMACFQVASVAC